MTSTRTTLAALLIAVAALAGCASAASEPTAETEVVPTTRIVEITLTGVRVTSADTTIRVGNDTTQMSVDVPMTNGVTGKPGMSFTAPAGTFVYFSAQIESETGELDCELTAAGTAWSTVTPCERRWAASSAGLGPVTAGA